GRQVDYARGGSSRARTISAPGQKTGHVGAIAMIALGDVAAVTHGVGDELVPSFKLDREIPVHVREVGAHGREDQFRNSRKLPMIDLSRFDAPLGVAVDAVKLS